MILKRKLLDICWAGVILSVGLNYLSSIIFSLEIFSITGFFLIISDSNFKVTREMFRLIFILFFIFLGVFISRLFFTPYLSFVLNILFVIKILFFLLFVFMYVYRYRVPYFTIYILMFFVIPPFVYLMLGNENFVGSQFIGLHEDPNYSSPDYISSFVASLVVLNSSKKVGLIRICSIVVLLISLILIVYSGSRTAIISCSTVFFILVIKKILSFSFKNIFLSLFIIIIYPLLVYSFFALGYLDFLLSRFSTVGGGSILENERYFVWGLSFDLINGSGLFSGLGNQYFLDHIYHFGAHNSWLDLGIRYGNYTFYSISILSILGLVFSSVKFFTFNSKSLFSDTNLLFYLYLIGNSIMVFSISVSHFYHFYLLVLVSFFFVFFKSSYLVERNYGIGS